MNYTLMIFGLIAVALILVAWIVMSYRRMRMSDDTVVRAWIALKNVFADRFDVLSQVKEYADSISDEPLQKSILRSMNAYSRAYKTNNPERAGQAEKIFMKETIPLLAGAIKETGTMTETRELREGIARTDKGIRSERRAYNEVALRHNNNISQIPANLLAAVFKVEERKTFLAPEDADRQLLNLRFE